MAKPQDITKIRAGKHCRFLMHVYLIFVSKYHKCVLTKSYLGTMKDM